MATKKNRGAHIVAGAMNTLSYVLLIIGLSLIISTVGLLWANDVLALVKADQPATLKLTEDTASGAVASQLKEEGVIRYPFLFKLMTSFKHIDQFDAGTYELNSSMDYGQLMDALQTAQTTRGVVTVTIPEGYNLKEICALLVEKNVVRETVFWDVVNHYDFAHFMLQDVPMTDNRLEGYLFPDTYEFYTNYEKADAARDKAHTVDVVNKMLNNFVKKYTKAMRNLTEANGLTIAQVVNVASLIEKEAQKADERTVIASVIYNRLKDPGNFPYLQIDASIMYATGHKDALTAEDLKIDSPYNTYTNQGLPPTAICNPGSACLMAAIQPEKTKYYYYVAKADGSHIFSRTLAEHNKAVAKVAAGQ